MTLAPVRTLRRPRPTQRAPRPVCPRGHKGSTIWRDGIRQDTDKHATIIFRCDPGNGQPRHRFTWSDRMRWQPHDPNVPFHCAACEAAYLDGFGEHLGWRFDFSYRDAAQTLMLVGQGKSFRKTAAAVRNRARRWQGGIRHMNSREAQLAQSYVDHFAPLVLDALAPDTWPGTIVIDSLPIRRKAISGGQATSGGQDAGEIMVAVEAGAPNRPVLIQMQGGKDRQSWVRFFKTLQGRPYRIVADGDTGLEAAIRDLGWEQQGTVFYRCETHLILNAEEAAFADGLLEWKPAAGAKTDDELASLKRLLEPRRGRSKQWERTKLFAALRRSVESPADWERFKRFVRRYVPAEKTELRGWIRRTESLLRAQWPVRPGLGSQFPVSNQAVENTIRSVGASLSNRSVQFGNLARLNKTLALMCLDGRGLANLDRYEELIRSHFDASPGHTSAARWKGYHDQGASSIDRLVFQAKVAQAQAAAAAQTVRTTARRQAQTQRKRAHGLLPRLRRSTPRAYHSVVGLTVADIPAIAKQWHLQNALPAASVPASSRAQALWQCDVDPRHEWSAQVFRRCTLQPKCPFCTGKRVAAHDSLAAKFPEISAQWHPTQNGALIPDQVAPQSSKLVWWLCPRRHSYQRKVERRTVRGFGCTHARCRQRAEKGTSTTTAARRQRRIRYLANAGDAMLAGQLDATGRKARALDTAALNAARAHLDRLRPPLGDDVLAGLLHRGVRTIQQYNRLPPPLQIARRLQFLVEIADALGQHSNLANWLARPQSRLGDQSPADILLREPEWDPIKGGPATLLMLAKSSTGDTS